MYMLVCVHMCVYVCVYVFVCVSMAAVYVFLLCLLRFPTRPTQPFPTIFAYSSMYVLVCVHMCLYVCLYVCICVCMCEYGCCMCACVSALSAYVPMALSVEKAAGATYRMIWLIYTE